MKKYALFIRPKGSKRGTRWQRVSDSSYPLQTAIRVFQTQLLNYSLCSEFEPRLCPVMKQSSPQITQRCDLQQDL